MPNVRIALAIFAIAVSSVCQSLELSGGQSRGWKFAMTDDPSPPATAASSPARKQLTPAAKRVLAEAEARRKPAEANAKPPAKEFQAPKAPQPTPLTTRTTNA